MSSEDIVIRVSNLSKCYQIYENPRDRLKQFILPRIWHYIGKKHKNYYRDFLALNDVSFEVRKGETLGIIGRNGSGKSTLLQLICGTLTPTNGSIETHGRIAAMLELGSGFNPEFTGRENVYLNAAILGVEKEAIDERLEKVLSFAGLGDYIDQPMKTYSSGMSARLAFSTSIHVDPSILIVDEALSVGDAGFQLKCMLKMRDLQEQGVTIIFVSHDTSSVIRLCDRALVLEQGRLLPGDQNPLKSVKLYEQITRQISLPPELPNIKNVDSINYANELQGLEEVRIGSREAEYVSIQFLSEDSKEQEVFKSGQEIEIIAIINSKREFEKVASGFTLKNRAGIDVWGDNNLYADTPLSLKVGLTRLSYRFKLNIPAGEYFLYIGLADISNVRNELDQRWPVRRLTVVSERQSVGLAFAPATITLTTD